MGRSVSYATGSELIAYCEWWQPEPGDDDEYDYQQPDFDSFSWFIDDIQESAKSVWPSLTDCDKWLGREDHAILENDLAYIGVSEYCGVAAVWAIPKETHWSDTFDREQFGRTWLRRISPTFFKYFGTLDRIGGFSDGTSFYQRKDAA